MHPGWTLRSALLLGRIALLFSLVAPCQPGASPLSVLTRGFSTGALGRSRDSLVDFLADFAIFEGCPNYATLRGVPEGESSPWCRAWESLLLENQGRRKEVP